MASTVHLTLLLELTEPVTGSVGDADEQRGFCGWLEMHAAVESFCAEARAGKDRGGSTMRTGSLTPEDRRHE
jgi:hypothetical protein